MSPSERFREPVSSLPSAEVLREREHEGWRPVAIEWVRDGERPSAASPERHPIPFGLRISSDCSCLEVDPAEKEIMSLILALIADDHPLSDIADALNGRELPTRSGAPWTQVAIFKLLPRIVEFGPEILSADTWAASKRKLLAEVG